MASKVPIEAKMVAWFASAPAEAATKQFAFVRAVLADRKLLGKGTKAVKGEAKAKKAVVQQEPNA